MLKFIIRLDDACPTMNEIKWQKMENLLDKYDIKPIVGVIPLNKDKDFSFPLIKDFWNKYPTRWQKKGWIIAQHGLYHNLSDIVRTEFEGKDYEEQRKIINKGYKILTSHKIYPRAFFAPAHTFDDVTVKVCKDLGYFEFISDGYAFYPYKYKGMFFIPSVFDTPHKISNAGVFTFVYHPNKINDDTLNYLENFIEENRENFNIDYEQLISKYSNRKRNLKDKMLKLAILFYRKLRR